GNGGGPMEVIPGSGSVPAEDPAVPQRVGIRRVVIVVPSFFTLANLFFGFWAIVKAFNGDFKWAGFFIIFAGILDTLDGRVARLSNTGTRFGAELDSLVDVISFGMAPALLVYLLEFASAGKFGWVVCFLFVVAAALRLARFNVSAHGKPHSHWFTGLPSPAAGMMLASYYPFSQTALYRNSSTFLDLQHEGVTVLVLLLAALMVSRVPYPRGPRINLKTAGGIVMGVALIALIVAALLEPASVLFPFFLAFMLFGIIRSFVLSFIDRGDRNGEHRTIRSITHRRRRENP
ncbi:MAG: CDP-diacylglycerol--serine O-phosphatidyltransferase, partial [Gemmatimonadota bacterium]